MYRRSLGAASCILVDSVAGIGGEWGILLRRSEQSDSGVRSTPTGQSQLREWTKRRSESRVVLDSASFGNCTLSISGFGTEGMCAEARNPCRSAAQSPFPVLRCRPGRNRGPGRLAVQVGVVDGPGKGCAESPMRGRIGEPLPSSSKTESVRVVQGVYRSLSSVTQRPES